MAFKTQNIYDYLPKFFQIEANNLKALQPGFVVAQVDAIKANATFAQEAKNLKGSSATTATNLIANGHIVSLEVNNGKAEIADPSATGVLYIVYNDPLVTFGPDNTDYSRYATDVKGECLRLVQLIPGDEWTTDMTYDLTGALSGRIVEMTSENTDDWYANATLPDGTAAKHYIFLG